MDELSEITEFIHEMAGDEAEMIFGHGIDPKLGQSIRVTVITTGFKQDEIKPGFALDKKVYDLEKDNQTDLFDPSKDNNHNEFETKEPELKEKEPDEPIEKEELTEIEDKVTPEDDNAFERGYFFESVESEEKDGDLGLFEAVEDEFKVLGTQKHQDVIDDEEAIELKRKKELLIAQAQERVIKFRGSDSPDLDFGEFKEKLDVPAYLRKNVTLRNNPHSSESDISRFNLNDDNKILGNNKFLHDNVD
jgi:cell division protein FtsZ